MTARKVVAGSGRDKQVPERAEDICPILVGQSLPRIILKNPDKSLFDLNAAIEEKATVLVFFRGGWCPYCNLHLGHLQLIESELLKLGFQIIAVSADRPEILEVPAEKQEIRYRLLSDSEMKAALSLGIAFHVDDMTVEKYKTSLGTDLETDSGQKHHLLTVPAVFVVGQDGVIQFSYVNPNYKVRIDPGVLLKAAEAAMTGTVAIQL